MDFDLAPQVKQALARRWEPVYRSQLHYLVTWHTRGRRPVLKQRHVEALEAIVRQACDEREVELVAVTAASDQVRVLFGLRPAHSVASAVRELKGRTSMALFTQYPELRVWLRGNLLWDERYAVETVSPLRVEALRGRLGQGPRTHPEAEAAEPWEAAS